MDQATDGKQLRRKDSLGKFYAIESNSLVFAFGGGTDLWVSKVTAAGKQTGRGARYNTD